MKKLKHITLSLVIGAIFMLGACSEEDSPQPTILVFSLSSATFNGDAITPDPNYTLTLEFDADGLPGSYLASGSAPYQPTAGPSGTFAVSGDQVTFTSGSASRVVAVKGGTLSANSTSLVLEWSLEKTDVQDPADAGLYSFVMEVQ